jgi:pilus assembly protein FimV
MEEIEAIEPMSVQAAAWRAAHEADFASPVDDLDTLDVTPSETSRDSGAGFAGDWEADSGLWDEVATKIDLARAYVEMDDPDAARIILKEVAEEGNEEQRTEARVMLEQLG